MPVLQSEAFATEVWMLGAVDLVQPATAPQLFESGPITMDNRDDAKLVVSAVGSYSCADVWVSRPPANGQHYDLRLYARVGSARVLIAQVDPDTLAYTADGAREGTIAISIRGRPASAFELECAPTDDDITDIHFFMQAWHADVESNAAVGPDPMVSVRQGPAGAPSLRWPVYLSDGTSAQGIVSKPVFVRLGDGTAALGTTSNPLRSEVGRTAYPTFSAASDRVLQVATSVAAGTSVSLATLWHPSGNTQRVELRRVVVTYFGANGTGSIRLRGTRLTGGTAPTGTGVAALPHEIGDATSVTFIPNPTSVAGRSATDFFMAMIKPNEGRFEWNAGEDGKPIVLRASQSEGFEVRAHVEVQLGTSAMNFGVYFQWVEI